MTKSIEQMNNFALSRWLALTEAVNIVADECKMRNIDFNTIKLEPLTLRKYIEGTCDIYCRKLEEQQARQSKFALTNFNREKVLT